MTGFGDDMTHLNNSPAYKPEDVERKEFAGIVSYMRRCKSKNDVYSIEILNQVYMGLSGTDEINSALLEKKISRVSDSKTRSRICDLDYSGVVSIKRMESGIPSGIELTKLGRDFKSVFYNNFY